MENTGENSGTLENRKYLGFATAFGEEFFWDVGRRCGERPALNYIKAVNKEKALQRSLRPDKRSEIVKEAIQGQYASIENKYAQALLEAGEFTQSTLPAPKYVLEVKTKTKSSEQHLPSASASTTKLQQFDRPGSEFDAVAVITYADILRRLSISNLPAEVSLRNLDFLNKAQLSQVLSMSFEGADQLWASKATVAYNVNVELNQDGLCEVQLGQPHYKNNRIFSKGPFCSDCFFGWGGF